MKRKGSDEIYQKHTEKKHRGESPVHRPEKREEKKHTGKKHPEKTHTGKKHPEKKQPISTRDTLIDDTHDNITSYGILSQDDMSTMTKTIVLQDFFQINTASVQKLKDDVDGSKVDGSKGADNLTIIFKDRDPLLFSHIKCLREMDLHILKITRELRDTTTTGGKLNLNKIPFVHTLVNKTSYVEMKLKKSDQLYFMTIEGNTRFSGIVTQDIVHTHTSYMRTHSKQKYCANTQYNKILGEISLSKISKDYFSNSCTETETINKGIKHEIIVTFELTEEHKQFNIEITGYRIIGTHKTTLAEELKQYLGRFIFSGEIVCNNTDSTNSKDSTDSMDIAQTKQ